MGKAKKRTAQRRLKPRSASSPVDGFAVQPLACSYCNSDKVTLFSIRPNNALQRIVGLVAICDRCKSQTLLNVPSPELKICWPSAVPEINTANGQGLLCDQYGPSVVNRA